MNRHIQSLTNLLNQTKATAASELAAAKAKLNAEWAKVFADSSELKADFEALESSREYGSDGMGIYSWHRLKFQVPDDEYAKDALCDYVSEHGYAYDSENDCILNYQGECIVINDDGDVFLADCGNSKCIIDAKAYTEHGEANTALRNELIENWMEKTGYFPGVFREDRHGNVFPVNTQTKKGN